LKPPQGTVLCRIEDLADPGTKDFAFGEGMQRFDLFVVRAGAKVRAYVNVCPHRGTPLNFLPDHFLTAIGDSLLCATHGAQFRISDGRCLLGPCKGQSLKPLDLVILDGAVALA